MPRSTSALWVSSAPRPASLSRERCPMSEMDSRDSHDRDRGRDRGDRDNRDGGKDDDEGRGGRRSFHRKKVCRFCADNEYLLDYKDARMMQQFVMDLGKI